jgi:hypothetical protein
MDATTTTDADADADADADDDAAVESGSDASGDDGGPDSAYDGGPDSAADGGPACGCDSSEFCDAERGCVSICGASTGERGRALVIGEGDLAAPFVCMLEADGFVVDRSPDDAAFDGSTELTAFDVAVVLDGTEYGTDMPMTGQAALASFIDGGGGLVSTEWLLWEHATSGNYATLAPVVPATYAGSYAQTTTYRVATPAHVIATGLPTSFTAPAHWVSRIAQTSSGEAVATEDDGDPLVVAGAHGAGRAVHFAAASDYAGFRWLSSAELTTLFVQAVRWAAGSATIATSVTSQIASDRCACP